MQDPQTKALITAIEAHPELGPHVAGAMLALQSGSARSFPPNVSPLEEAIVRKMMSDFGLR